MRLILLMLLAACVVSWGCKSSNRRDDVPTPSGGRSTNEPFWADSRGENAPTRAPASDVPVNNRPPAKPDGILAGRLVDPFNRGARNAFLQISKVSEDGSANPKPIGVEADRDGYFLIQGLDPGATYMITARTDDGDRTLAGAAQAKPPYTRLLIRLSENKVSELTAPPPPAPGLTQPFEQRSSDPPETDDRPPGRDPFFGDADRSPLSSDRNVIEEPPAPDPVSPGAIEPGSARPNREPPPKPAELSLPDEGQEPDRDQFREPTDPWLDDRSWAPGPPKAPSANPSADLPRPAPIIPSAPENIAEGPQPFRPPVASIPGPDRDPPPSAPPPPAPKPPRRDSSNDGAMSQPALKRNFTLYDLQGKPWEFRQHSGRLVLLDFWATWCTPCLRAMPEMKQLARQYGAAGLEVIGVAVDDGPWRERVAEVDRVRQQFSLNYAVYIDAHQQGTAQAMFRISSLPTMVLLDCDGTILWRGTPQQKHQLEAILRQRLGR